MAVEARPLAVVTGASSGIGRELARCCVENGFDVLTCADEPEVHDAARELEALAPLARVTPVEADLSTPEGIEALCEAIGARPVDALLANAGRDGIELRLEGANLDNPGISMNNNTITASTMSGIRIVTSANNNHVDVLGGTVTGSGDRGLLYTANSATNNSIEVRNGRYTGNALQGVEFEFNLASTIVGAAATNLILTGNTGQAALIRATGTATSQVQFLGNTSNAIIGVPDYQFEEVGVVADIKFQSASAPEAVPFPIFAATSQVNGTFVFVNMEAGDDAGAPVFP